MFKRTLILFCIMIFTQQLVAEGTESPKWVKIFNGKDLSGWTPKFKGYKLGENYLNTFRVTDGVLDVNYSDYKNFKGQFGHLFYKGSYSHYRLKLEYRFYGEQLKGAPKFGYRNNGIMFHGQSAESMGLNQAFPTSIELQLLGTGTTGNVGTPGTHIVIDGKLIKEHVTNSKIAAGEFGEWQSIEIEVLGSEVVRHIINDKVILEYRKPQLNNGKLLERGSISLQAETHPTQFRNIELMVIKE